VIGLHDDHRARIEAPRGGEVHTAKAILVKWLSGQGRGRFQNRLYVPVLPCGCYPPALLASVDDEDRPLLGPKAVYSLTCRSQRLHAVMLYPLTVPSA
jgi:hypothetical protein